MSTDTTTHPCHSPSPSPSHGAAADGGSHRPASGAYALATA